ncbi:MAG: RNA-binding S4 domain-containing protein [bacterium]|nr:RNA-binding S4 domain-containing protein [bacterium]
MTETEKKDTQRLDKWLKIARLFKTRSIAADACDGRLVKVNDRTAKSSKYIKAGDRIIIRKRGTYRSFKILDISHRSISSKLARDLYEETTEDKLTPEQKELIELQRKSITKQKPRYPGRPTKKDRRQISKFRGE